MASPRSKARQRALEILFEADLRGVDPKIILADTLARIRAQGSDGTIPAIQPYAITLIEGVLEHVDRIDDVIDEHSDGWALDRMPTVDRNVLRIGAYELLWQNDVPDAVVLDEAVSLVRRMSTDDSPQFVNGLLARLSEVKATLER
jgi:transcription antitermination protein NusB